MPKSRIGSRSRNARALDCPGSVDLCPATIHSRTPGARCSAATAAAELTTPSSRIGIFAVATPISVAVMATMSAPDPEASAASGSRSRIRSIAAPTTSRLHARDCSSMPVPVPVVSSAEAPMKCPMTAAAAVVFPMPMSPGMKRSAPVSTMRAAIASPA